MKRSRCTLQAIWLETGARMSDSRKVMMGRSTIGIVALVAALCVVFASISPAQARTRHCGKVTTVYKKYKSKYRVRIDRGSVSCKKARWAIKAYNEGKGTLHKSGKGRVNWYTTLPGGWSCASGAGGEEGCTRGPKIDRYQRRDQVYASPIF